MLLGAVSEVATSGDSPRTWLEGARPVEQECDNASTAASDGLNRRTLGGVARLPRYVFFDGLHPTDAVNARIARKGYGSSSPEHAYPINVKKLAML